jgi:hypothetical protein
MTVEHWSEVIGINIDVVLGSDVLGPFQLRSSAEGEQDGQQSDVSHQKRNWRSSAA